MAKMTFTSVYPYAFTKVERKGITKEGLQQVIVWLNRFNYKRLSERIDEIAIFKTCFIKAR